MPVNEIKNVLIWNLIPFTEGRINPDGHSVTTSKVLNIGKYPGGTNQVEVRKIILEGKEFWVYIKAK